MNKFIVYRIDIIAGYQYSYDEYTWEVHKTGRVYIIKDMNGKIVDSYPTQHYRIESSRNKQN